MSRDAMRWPGIRSALSALCVPSMALSGHRYSFPESNRRLRLMIGSHARRDNFGFSAHRQIQRMASDAGLIKAAVERTWMMVSPGTRSSDESRHRIRGGSPAHARLLS